MGMHPPARRQDCPKGGACLDPHCKLLHPTTRNLRPRLATTATTTTPDRACTTCTCTGTDLPTTTAAAESALKLLMTVVDSNEDFLSVPENRRLLEILGLKAKK